MIELMDLVESIQVMGFPEGIELMDLVKPIQVMDFAGRYRTNGFGRIDTSNGFFQEGIELMGLVESI